MGDLPRVAVGMSVGSWINVGKTKSVSVGSGVIVGCIFSSMFVRFGSGVVV
jgi:hypothetical protein